MVDFAASRHVMAAGPFFVGGAVVADTVAGIVHACGDYFNVTPPEGERWTRYRATVAELVADALQHDTLDRAFGPGWRPQLLDPGSANVLRLRLRGAEIPADWVFRGAFDLIVTRTTNSALPQVAAPGRLVVLDADCDEELVRTMYVAGGITSMSGFAFVQEGSPGMMPWDEPGRHEPFHADDIDPLF